MRGDHERAQELLAGEALHALTDADRREAARLLFDACSLGASSAG